MFGWHQLITLIDEAKTNIKFLFVCISCVKTCPTDSTEALHTVPSTLCNLSIFGDVPLDSNFLSFRSDPCSKGSTALNLAIGTMADHCSRGIYFSSQGDFATVAASIDFHLDTPQIECLIISLDIF